MPEHAAAAALPAAPALSPLQHMLAAGIAALRCEPDGAELYAALERSAGAELALLDQP